MKLHNTRKYSIVNQTLLSVFLILSVSFTCFFIKSFLGYKIIAMLLLMMVSVLAMLFDIIPVLTSAVLSALIWNFFFIPPIFTFHISDTEDILMFILYFVIALVNAVLTFQIRKEELKSRDKEEKEKTIKLYNTLLNSLSHELRTPIATIISSVDSLKEESRNLSSHQQSELLNQIDIATSRLNRQVENLLHMSRLESGMLKLNYEWIDIHDLVCSTIEKLTPYSESHSIIYEEKQNLPFFKLDAGILEQVIYNILVNAIQYTPKGTLITVQVSLENQELLISIFDNGHGVSSNELEYIFDKFYRVPNSKTGGSGLGLSIVKGFVEAHNGSIKGTQNIPSGLRFDIKLDVEVSYINNLKNE